MTSIYAVNIKDLSDEDFYNIDLRCISSERRVRIQRMRFVNDRKLSFLSELLLYYGFDQKLKGNKTIKYDENGKPFFADYPEFGFNISHSGEWAAAAFSNYEVGIDIEKIDSAKMDIAERFFHINEYNKLISIENEEEKNRYFYTLWTLKECYLKNTGIGLKGMDQSLRFEINEETECFKDDVKVDKQFFSMLFDDGYCMSVCCDKKEVFKGERSIQMLSVSDLIDKYYDHV